MKYNPADHQPTGSFAESMSMEPQGAASEGIGNFKLGLYKDDTRWGWLGQNSNGWGILVKSADEAVILEEYYYGGKMYYRIVGGKYLSCNASGWSGFYVWAGADDVRHAGGRLVCGRTGHPMSVYESGSGATVYFWNGEGYQVMDVKKE